MTTWMRRRAPAEDGMTLVEVMVAVVILGVVLSASAAFLITALTAIQRAESRTKATALANEELENLRALPWDQVGFYGDDFASLPQPQDTVILDTTRPAGARAPLPVQSNVMRGGVAFTVTRLITWERVTQTGNADDYKNLFVQVEWSDRGQERSISVESARSPSPGEQPASNFVLSLLDAQPDLAYINPDGSLDPAENASLALTALTSARAEFVYMEYHKRGANNPTRVYLGTSGDQRNWNLSLPSGEFPNGDVILTFTATRSSPYEQEVLGQKLVRFLQPVEVDQVGLSPSAVCVRPGDLAPQVAVTVVTEGLVEEDEVEVSWNGRSVTAAHASAGVAGSTFAATIPEGTYQATTDVTVTARRLSDGESASGSTVLPVTVDEECVS